MISHAASTKAGSTVNAVPSRGVSRWLRRLSRVLWCGALLGSATLAMAQSSGITVRAWATLAANVGPQMELRVNGTVVASTEVRASSYQNHSFPAVSVPAGAKVEVVFNNDAFASDGDRNLFVESITVNGSTIAATASGVVFDRGPGAQAFDGVDVMPGLSTLYWNGALRFQLTGGGATTPPVVTPPVTTDTPPAGYSRCASENQNCAFTGTANVVYGALNTWTAPRSFTGGTACTNAVFGDPLIGTFKACYMKPTATTPTPLSLNLTITGTGGVGFSDGSNCAASCSKTFNSGSTVTLAAAPSTGYTFAGWGGACAGTSTTCTVTMDAAKSVSATFSASPVTLNVSVSGSGTVNSTPSGLNCGASCSANFARGTNVTLTATPASGFTFSAWSGACTGTSTCTVTMNASANVSAVFVSSGASPITLSLVPNRTSGVAPLAVFFDASGTTSTATTMPFHDIKYSWNFGDAANGAMWAHGTRPGQLSKNLAYGGVAGHVFETPGTYTVTLTAFDGQRTSSKTTTITVTDPNVAFAGQNTVCVANGSLPVAGVNGCPVGAALANLSSLQVVADTLIQQTGRRILLKRGDVWTAVPDTYIQFGDIQIGAYGVGNPPLIRLTTANVAGINFYSNRRPFNNVTVMDLDFVGAGGAGYIFGIGNDFSVSNLTILRLRGSGTGGIATGGDGISVTDCDLSNLVGGLGYVGIWAGNSSRVAIQGNRVYDATRIEHNIRTHATKEVISNNSLYGPALTKQAITVRGIGLNNTTAWSGIWAEHIVVSDNDVDAGPNAGQLVEFAPTNSNQDERIRDVIFERNYVHGSVGTLLISEVSERATIRNNLFVPTYDDYPTITVMFKNTAGSPRPTSHFIYNNSFYQPVGAKSNYVAISVAVWSGNTVYPSGTVAKNNLAYAPFATGNSYNTNPGPMFLGTWAPASNYTLSNNSTDAQMKSVAPGFVTPPSQLSDWKPTSGYAIGGGAAVPVWDDFFLKPRSNPADIGAVQH